MLAAARVSITRVEPTLDATLVAPSDADGTFRFSQIDPGRYVVVFSNAFLDSLEYGGRPVDVVVLPGQTSHVTLSAPSGNTLAAAACSGMSMPSGLGVVLGRVSDADAGRPLPDSYLLLAWNELSIDSATHTVGSVEQIARTKADASGDYRLCGVPTNQWLSIQVQHDSLSGAILRVFIQPDVGVQLLNLSINTSQMQQLLRTSADGERFVIPTGTATLVGSALTSNGTPIVGAQVSVLSALSETHTDERGQFSLQRLPAGTRDLQVRSVGFRRHYQLVELRNGATTRLDVRLERVVILDSVAVNAPRLQYPDFESHRKLATNARFMTDADFDWRHVNGVSDILGGVVGFAGRVVGQGSNASVPGCAVVVDNMPEPQVPGGTGGQLNNIPPSDVGALEFYPAGSRSAPMQLHSSPPSRGGVPQQSPGCVIMIWTKSWASARAAKR